MGSRPEAILIYGIRLGEGYDKGSVLKTLSVMEGLDIDAEDNPYADEFCFPETSKLYDIGTAGTWEEYSVVVGVKGARFRTDWDTDKPLSVKDLQPKPEWSNRLDKIAKVFDIEDTPVWYLMASQG